MILTDILMLLATGLLAGFAGGLFGIGGGVIIVPALYAVFSAHGVDDDVRIKLAIGTSLATIIVTSIRSVQAHTKAGNVDWLLLKSWALWIAIGAVGGSVIARIAAPTALTLFFGLGLMVLGGQRLLARRKDIDPSASLPARAWQRIMATLTGVASSLLGIGGGVIGVLILTRAGRTVHRAVGTAAGFGLAIAAPGALGYMIMGLGADVPPWSLGFVSLPAFAAVATGTALAAPWGARTATRLSAVTLSLIFGSYVVITGALMIRSALTGG
ncbi:sulfite exporter TauE/SafE family protein [Parvularcula sp. LCG005]|uniref:sulfite exporter TauE/SafE family protein n=1 Tax=Parvularcula sp. LCG005 TaxID=3078805 RepID=UPI00294287EA|nr:sulfite exporter TauE/SafE family protein [Parvularcula sp. LCG005]WOI54103.1 sulfite exporter TauE/SafE family protein [Parvularcula sp. LCG005]